MIGEEVLDADAESASEFGDGVGARRFVALLPESDVLLGLADEASELGLAKSGGFSKSDEASTLSGSRLVELTRHGEIVVAGFDFPCLERIARLRCYQHMGYQMAGQPMSGFCRLSA